MTVDKILQFIIGNNGTIIWVLFALILILTIFVSFKMFFSKSDADAGLGDGIGSNFHQIEESLKKILEKGVPLTSGGTESVAGSAAVSNEVVDGLRAQLAEKERELQTARSEVSGGGANKEEISKLEDKVKELEVRLAEYEIIAEDIADLSRYKEENNRLKKEIEQLRAGGGSKPAAAPSAPIAPAPVENFATPASIEEPAPAAVAAAALTPEPPVATPSTPAAAPVPAAAAPAGDDSGFIDDDIMAEFARAVEAQKSGTLSPTEAAPAPAPAAAPPAPAKSAQDDIDAIMAQAAAEPTPEPTPAPTPAIAPEAVSEKEDKESDGGDAFAIDVDKMVAEAADLGEAPVSDVDNVLDATLDEDKLLAEAGLMANNDDKKSEKDKEKETASLMGEFENFVGKQN